MSRFEDITTTQTDNKQAPDWLQRGLSNYLENKGNTSKTPDRLSERSGEIFNCMSRHDEKPSEPYNCASRFDGKVGEIFNCASIHDGKNTKVAELLPKNSAGEQNADGTHKARPEIPDLEKYRVPHKGDAVTCAEIYDPKNPPKYESKTCAEIYDPKNPPKYETKRCAEIYEFPKGLKK